MGLGYRACPRANSVIPPAPNVGPDRGGDSWLSELYGAYGNPPDNEPVPGQSQAAVAAISRHKGCLSCPKILRPFKRKAQGVKRRAHGGRSSAEMKRARIDQRAHQKSWLAGRLRSLPKSRVSVRSMQQPCCVPSTAVALPAAMPSSPFWVSISGAVRGSTKVSESSLNAVRRLLYCAAKPARSYQPFDAESTGKGAFENRCMILGSQAFLSEETLHRPP